MKIMKRKKINLYGGAALITTALLLSSCINDVELADPGSGTSDKTLTLTIRTDGTDNTETRVYNQSSDPGTTTENTINRVTVGVFGSDNNVKIIKEFASGDAGLTGVTNNTVTVTSASLASGDQVLVAVNAPSGRFSGVTTVSDFESKTMSIDESLATSASGSLCEVEVPGNLPMFGTGSIGIDFSGITVSVYHLVSKVSLNSLKVDFDATGAYSAATFKPEEVFLLNVPNKLKTCRVGETYTYCTPSGSEGDMWCHGFSTAITAFQAKPYLGTGDISSGQTALSGTSGTWGSKQYFYTMPNSGSSNKTRLVIKGSFDPDGSGETVAKDYYYPITINSGKVVPNQNYVLDVTIKSIGTESPTGTVSSESVEVTVSVQGFVEAQQNEIFN